MMNLKTFLKSVFQAEPDGISGGFEIHPDKIGLNFIVANREFDQLLEGKGNITLRYQFTVLRMLAEQGLAEELANGFHVVSEDIVSLDDEQAEILQLPKKNPYPFSTRVNGLTSKNSFEVQLFLSDKNELVLYKRKGPFLYITENEYYRLNPGELVGLQAVEKHCTLIPDERTEGRNLRVIAELQTAKNSGMSVDLSHFEKLDVAPAGDIGVVASVLPSGALRLYPSFGGKVDVDELEKRWGQLDFNEDGGVVRVGNKIVLLDEQRLKAVNEVLTNRQIPHDKVSEFMNFPTAFLDASLVNLELGFSVRVAGIGKLKHIAFGSDDKVKNNWFSEDLSALPAIALLEHIANEDDLAVINEEITKAHDAGAQLIEFEKKDYDVSELESLEKFYEAAEAKIERLRTETIPAGGQSETVTKEAMSVVLKEVEDHNHKLLSKVACINFPVDIPTEKLNRTPFPHQREGISWLVNLLQASRIDDHDDMHRVQGALLADDMGLGKTYMTLIALEHYMTMQRSNNETEKPILIVAPLSLIENWEDEINVTFKESPFRDIVSLQSGRDLTRYKIPNVRRESVQLGELDEEDVPAESIRYALYAGPEAGLKRLDMDRRIILVTYQTLRDYQFSLCRIDWGIVVFDEAQNIKNPNTLQTMAAKGLKADFKLLVTGTPIENSLSDFWCLLDTAQPGLLGPWQVFRERWIKPIAEAGDDAARNEVRAKIGQELREAVGTFMLRRTKEGELTGLPKKTIYSGVSDRNDQVFDPSLGEQMTGEQLRIYEHAINEFQESTYIDESRTQALTALFKLRKASLHPHLFNSTFNLPNTSGEARSLLEQSAKLRGALAKLDVIKRADEKVILFLTTKALQRSLKLWLDVVYELNIGVINGDTKAVANKAESETRKSIIKDFECKPGFNILIMSPVAAGVGLTVIGANHVIHVERHWNPAKEAQASDRVYRIGQQRPVSIYLPASLHPTFDSFDVNLDRLLSSKLMLKDAVVTQEGVSENEMLKALGEVGRR